MLEIRFNLRVFMAVYFWGGACQQEVPLDKIVISQQCPGFKFSKVGIDVCYPCHLV